MRRLVIALGVALALLAASAGAIGWLVATESGLRWLASHAGERLEVEGLRGTLVDEIATDRLVYAGEGLRVEARAVRLRAHLAALLGGRLTLDPVRIDSLVVEFREQPGGAPASPPDLPLRLHVADARIERLELVRAGTRTVFSEVRLEHARLGDDVSAAGAFRWTDERFPTQADVRVRGDWQRLELEADGEVAGVRAEARARVAPYARERVEALEARFGPVDLARFVPAAPRTALRATIKAESAIGGAFRGTLAAVNESPGPLDEGRLPLERAQASFFTDLASARFERISAALPGGGMLTGDGELHPGRARAKLVAQKVDLRAMHGRLRRTALFGPFELELDRERQRFRGSLTQAGIGLYAELERAGETIDVRELAAIAEGGEVRASGTVWLGERTRFEAAAAVHAFDPSAFGDYPPGSLSGLVNAAGHLEPRDVALDWRLADSTLYGHRFDSTGAARWRGERVADAEVEIRIGENRLTARGAYGSPDDTLALALDAPRLEQLAPVGGRLRAEGTLTGTLERPRAWLTGEAQALALPGGVVLDKVRAAASGTLEAHDIELYVQSPAYVDLTARLRGGWRRGAWQGELLSARNFGELDAEVTEPAALRLAPRRVELSGLRARVGEGRLSVREASWAPGRLASSGEFEALPAQWLIAAAGLGEQLEGALVLAGEWQLAQAEALSGFARVRRSRGDLSVAGNALGLERAMVEATFAGGRASAKGEMAARLGRLSVEGAVWPQVALEADVQFAELGTLAALPGESKLDGRLSARLAVSGTLSRPVLRGTLAGEALAFEYPPYGVRFAQGSLAAALEGDALRIDALELRGGEGRLVARGTLPLGRDGTTSLAWRAERLTVFDRPDRRLVVSGGGDATYDGTRLSLGGALRADRGYLEFERDRLPELGDDVVIVGEEKPPAAPSPLKAKLPLVLSVRLDMGDELVVRGYGYDGKVAGNVELATNDEGELRAFGTLRAVNATFFAYGQRLAVDPGVLIFDGPLDNPSLQITAWRRNQAVEAGVQMTGTARAPILQLVSKPPVPEAETLSWLVLGRPPTSATQADLGLLQAAAGALLAGGDAVPLDRRIADRLGLDEVSLRGTGEAADRVVAFGKRLSDRLYVSYEQGIGAVASNLIKLDYALGRHWTLRGETGTSSGGGIFFRYSWD